MTLLEAELLALRTLKQVMEEKISDVNVEVAVLPVATGKYTVQTREAVAALLQQMDAPSTSSSSSLSSSSAAASAP